MPTIPVANSFIADDREVSYYDLVLPLFRMNADGTPAHLVATCFPIGRGIYLTAAHVFEGFEEARNRYKRPTGERTAPTPAEMAERLRRMQQDRFWEGADVNCGALILDQAAIRNGRLQPLGFSLVTSVIMTLDFDLAVLFIKDDLRRNAQGESTPVACFSLIEHPRVGQKISVAGFPGANNKFEVTSKEGTPHSSLGLALVVNEGTITDLHHEMRDAGHAFFPCLQTDINIASGQSGGPAFCRETLGVVGINSIGGIAGGVVSWVGKALDAELKTPIALTIGGQSVGAGESTSLRQMASAGLLQVFRE